MTACFRVALAAMVALCSGAASTPGLAADAVPGTSVATELTGDWVLNAAASDPSPLPPPRPRPAGDDPSRQVLHAIPPEDSVLPDPVVEVDPATGQPRPVRRRPPAWLFRPERLEALRVLLGDSPTLSIVQTTTYVDLRTSGTARSLELGAESQVSLPTGELADQRVRWRQGRLIVERRVPRGPKLVETYRLLPATDQLEVEVRRSADGGFPKLAWRRVFDRERDEVEPARAAAPGPAGDISGP